MPKMDAAIRLLVSDEDLEKLSEAADRQADERLLRMVSVACNERVNVLQTRPQELKEACLLILARLTDAQ